MGFLRLLLAVFVAQQHLYIHPFTGSISVFAFFLLSGFLVTMMVNEVYDDGIRGKCLFLLNRFLRIYPVYWVCLKFGIFFLTKAPWEAYHLIHDMALPSAEWWRQYYIFGQVRLDGTLYMPRVLEPAWSLNIELVYYLVIGLFVGKSKQLCWCFFGFAFYHLYAVIYHSRDFGYVYFSYLGNAMQFALGTLAYHYRHLFPRWRYGGQGTLLLLVTVIVLLPIKIPFLQRYWIEYHYSSLLLFMYIIPTVFWLGQERVKKRGVRWIDILDRWCGRISYPFFLLHCAAGAYVAMRWVHFIGRHWDVYTLGMLYALFLSILIVIAVELPLESIRKAIRDAAAKRTQS